MPCSKCRRGASIAARHREPLLDRPHHRLQDRRADPVGAGAAEGEDDLAVAQDHGRRHHRGTRRPGAIRWKPAGLRSSSPSMLLRITPVPGTSTPEPEPLEQVTLAQLPSASRTEMWVVEPSRSAAARSSRIGSRKPDLHPLLVEGLGEGEVAARVGRLHRRHQLLGSAAGAEALEQAEAVGDQDPARGGRRVGEDFGAAEAACRSACARSPRRRRGRRGPIMPPWPTTKSLIARRDLTLVEEVGPLVGEAFQRLRQFREGEDVSPRRSCRPCGA